MSQKIDLRALEKKVLHTYIQDGLLDIVLGVQLVLLSLFLRSPSFSFVVAWIPLALGGIGAIAVLVGFLRRYPVGELADDV